MRKNGTSVLLSTAAIILLLPASARSQGGRLVVRRKALPVIMCPQEKSLWCWAACGQMVMEYLRPEIRQKKSALQCQQATNRGCGHDCCDHPNAPRCNETDWPDFRWYGFSCRTTISRPLLFRQIMEEIDQNRPICFTQKRLSQTMPTMHMVVVKGYSIVADKEGKEPDEEWILIHDPAPIGKGTPNLWIRYEDYCEQQDGDPAYAHGDDFYEIRYEL